MNHLKQKEAFITERLFLFLRLFFIPYIRESH